MIGNTAEGCEADASNAPLTEWQYRFNPLSEREQKRQYRTSGPQEYYGLAWVYYQLGVDNKTLTTFNGIEGSFCGSPASTVSLWPVEYNTYGPMNTRIITRPDNTREYVVADHLGSSRAVVSGAGAILQRTDYEAIGGVRTSEGEGARTTYIGREEDQESGLGFYGVRLYEPEYGRFTSVDAMWGKYVEVNPYHYSLNQPLTAIDPDGRDLIILVDVEGANRLGHAAVLIGNDKDGWQYRSLDGSKDINRLWGTSKNKREDFDNLEEFLSNTDTKLDLSKYDIGFQIKEDTETDKKFLKGADSETEDKKEYDVLNHSCIDVVSGALEAAGYWGGDRGQDVPIMRILQILISLDKAGVPVKTLNFMALRQGKKVENGPEKILKKEPEEEKK